MKNEIRERILSKFNYLVENLLSGIDFSKIEEYNDIDFTDNVKVNNFSKKIDEIKEVFKNKIEIIDSISVNLMYMNTDSLLNEKKEELFPYRFLHLPYDSSLEEIRNHGDFLVSRLDNQLKGQLDGSTPKITTNESIEREIYWIKLAVKRIETIKTNN